MELKKLNKILKAVEGTPIKKITLESNLVKLHLVKGDTTTKSIANGDPMHFILENGEKSPDTQSNTTSNRDITSSEVGYFSRFHPKKKEHIVKLRDAVKKGDLVAVVKASDIKYEVFSQISGKITQFLVEEGQPVEYGQPLIRLEDEQETITKKM